MEKYYEVMNLCHSLYDGEPTKEKKAEIHKVNKEYSLAVKKLQDYQDVLENRRMKMTLDEAIAHAKELSESQSVCEDCREEHKQLAEWLEELNEYKKANKKLEHDN